MTGWLDAGAAPLSGMTAAALAEMAGREFGAHTTGVTLSHEQLRYAQQRMGWYGLQHNSDLRLQDYRDITDGPFDAICSIEMVEAVGREYWPTYFETVARLLKPGGRACIQSIVIDDALFDAGHHLHLARDEIVRGAEGRGRPNQ